jgi:hypothetical protein
LLDSTRQTFLPFASPTPTTADPNATTPKSLSIVEVKKLLQLIQWYRQHYPDLYVLVRLYCRRHLFETFRDAPTSAPEAELSTARITLADAERDLATFEKGKRRDITDFPKLSEEKHWMMRKRRTETTAFSNGLANVLDFSYVPEPGPATALFEGQMDFMYAAPSMQRNRDRSPSVPLPGPGTVATSVSDPPTRSLERARHCSGHPLHNH